MNIAFLVVNVLFLTFNGIVLLFLMQVYHDILKGQRQATAAQRSREEARDMEIDKAGRK